MSPQDSEVSDSVAESIGIYPTLKFRNFAFSNGKSSLQLALRHVRGKRHKPGVKCGGPAASHRKDISQWRP